jgi:hypothetical protein
VWNSHSGRPRLLYVLRLSHLGGDMSTPWIDNPDINWVPDMPVYYDDEEDE